MVEAAGLKHGIIMVTFSVITSVQNLIQTTSPEVIRGFLCTHLRNLMSILEWLKLQD
jgi:hypothetical protein